MGVWQNLSGENTKQIEETIKKHLEKIRKIQTSSLEKKVVWRGMIGVIWASMRYGLPAYAIKKEEGNKLIKEIFRPLLNAIGVHSKFPTDIMTLPVKYMGLGIPDPYVEGGITRVKWFINHMGADTLTAKYMDFSLQNMMIETDLLHNTF